MSAGENPCIQATPVEDPIEDRWRVQHEKFVEKAEQNAGEVIFLGDSIIQNLQITRVWARHFEQLHSLNFGIGGDRTENVLWRVQNGELEHITPKAVVILVGTNNHGNTSEQIAEGIIKICETVREKLPETLIVVLSLLPRGRMPSPLRERNALVNQIVQQRSTSIDNCHYLDVTEGLVQQNGSISDYHMIDYLHLTAEGYRTVFTPVYDFLVQEIEQFANESMADSLDETAGLHPGPNVDDDLPIASSKAGNEESCSP